MNKYSKITGNTAFVGALLLANAATASAHGYVGNEKSDVVARAAMDGNTGLGPVQWEPQSIEGPKGFSLDASTGGPADGQLASAETSLAANLDEQAPGRWVGNDVEAGQTIDIGWDYSAPHKTSQWHYYITEEGWDQNSPLSRSDLQPLGVVEHDGSAAPRDTAHQMQLPPDLTGDHVIYAVWDVADTENAFYNVIDLNIGGDGSDEPGDPEEPAPTGPSTPADVRATNATSTSVDITWSEPGSDVAVDRYEVERAVEGEQFEPVGEVTGTTFEDTDLTAATSYEFRVIAIDEDGNRSEPGTVSVTTPGDDGSPEEPGEPSVAPWDPAAAYEEGDRVSHDGAVYEAVQSHQGVGDPSWIDAGSLWQKVD